MTCRTPPLADEIEPLAIAPLWAKSVVLTCVLLIAAGVALIGLGVVDRTAHARGVLRLTGGSHALASPTPGVVKSVRVSAGAHVKAGEVLVELDNAPMRAELQAAEAALTQARSRLDAVSAGRGDLYVDRNAAMSTRVGTLTRQARLHRESAHRAEERLQSVRKLASDGAASRHEVLAAQDALAEVQRAELEVLSELGRIKTDESNNRLDEDAERRKLVADVDDATNRLASLRLAEKQTTVVAPLDGRVDTVLVKPADTLQAGAVVVRLLPDEAPLQIVAFVSERERAFVSEGNQARVELDQFPVTEFGHVQARVTRIGEDIATLSEVREVMGESFTPSAPMVRVELEAELSASPQMAKPGAMLTSHIITRRQRILGIVFEPARKWLSGESR